MTYQVIILPNAEVQIYKSAIWWSENRSTQQAIRWVEGIESAIHSLVIDPEQHGIALENDAFSFTLRQLLYGLGSNATHRVLFEIRDDKVLVHTVRHVAQKEVGPEDV